MANERRFNSVKRFTRGYESSRPGTNGTVLERDDDFDSGSNIGIYLRDIGAVPKGDTSRNRDLARRKETWAYAQRVRYSIGAEDSLRGSARIFDEAYKRLQRETSLIQALVPEEQRASADAALFSLEGIGMAVVLDSDIMTGVAQAQGIIPDAKYLLGITKDITAACRLLPSEMLRSYAHYLVDRSDTNFLGVENFINDPQNQQLLEDRLSHLRLDAREAHRELIESNLKWVVIVAKKFVGRGMDIEDLVQAGNLGLIRGAEKYEYHTGFDFLTYATGWIRQSILRTIGDQARTIRLPIHMGEGIARVASISERLFQDLRRNPTPEEVGLELERKTETIERIISAANSSPLSLDKPIWEDDINRIDSISCDKSLSPDEKTSSSQLSEILGDVLSELSERERRVLKLRYGLGDGKDRTLSEVGGELGVTRERARQIEARALKKLRDPDLSMRLKDFAE